MPRITVGTENNAPIEIHYEDHGSGQPVVLIHGYPLNGNSWERQERELLASGYRVITLRPPRIRPLEPADRRLRLRHLRRRPERAARAPRPAATSSLVGFSMGTGEVTRYLGTYGSSTGAQGGAARRDPAVPAQDRRQPRGRRRAGLRRHQGGDRQGPLRLLQGLPRQLLQRRRARRRPDQRPGLAGELQRRRRRVAVRDLRLRRHLADRLPRRPAEDRRARARRARHRGPDPAVRRDRGAAAGADRRLQARPVEGGPHNIGWTHPDEVNEALLEFIGAPVAAA